MTGIVYLKGMAELDAGGNIDYSTDSIKVALVTSAYTPDAELHQSYADIIGEVSGVGYSTGGKLLQGRQKTGSNPTYYYGNKLIWTAMSAINVRYALVYKDSGAPESSWLLACADLGEDHDLVNQDLVLNWEANQVFYTSAPGAGTFTKRVDATEDDGESNQTTGAFDLTVTRFGVKSNGNVVNAFMRFTNVAVPRGAEILNAYVTFIGAGSLQTANANIYLNDIDHAVSPINTAEYNGLVLTEPVMWADIPTWVLDEEYDSPDIKDIVQAVISRDGWSAGNAMLVLVKNNGGSRNRTACDYGTEPSKAAMLTIQYDTTISGVNTPVVRFYDTRIRLRARKRRVLLTTKVRNLQ